MTAIRSSNFAPAWGPPAYAIRGRHAPPSPGSAPGGGRQRGVLQTQEGGVQLVVREPQQPLRQRAPGGRVACGARAASARRRSDRGVYLLSCWTWADEPAGQRARSRDHQDKVRVSGIDGAGRAAPLSLSRSPVRHNSELAARSGTQRHLRPLSRARRDREEAAQWPGTGWRHPVGQSLSRRLSAGASRVG